MSDKFTSRQKQVLVVVPMGVLVLSLAAYLIIGVPALLVPPVLMGAFLIWMLLDLRHHHTDLFQRGMLEQRAIFSQLEAIVGLNEVLRPKYPFPGTRGWAASPDFLREVVNHVLTAPVELAVEASSGTSTLMIAYAMERKGSGRVIALEHDATYADRTRAMIGMHGLSHRATVVHAPLVRQGRGKEDLLWYDLSKVGFGAPIDLLVVDGPPEEVNALARYPAVPLLRDQFARGARVILDDGARHDERVISERWSREFAASACEYLELEKGAWSLRF